MSFVVPPSPKFAHKDPAHGDSANGEQLEFKLIDLINQRKSAYQIFANWRSRTVFATKEPKPDFDLPLKINNLSTVKENREKRMFFSEWRRLAARNSSLSVYRAYMNRCALLRCFSRMRSASVSPRQEEMNKEPTRNLQVLIGELHTLIERVAENETSLESREQEVDSLYDLLEEESTKLEQIQQEIKGEAIEKDRLNKLLTKLEEDHNADLTSANVIVKSSNPSLTIKQLREKLQEEKPDTVRVNYEADIKSTRAAIARVSEEATALRMKIEQLAEKERKNSFEVSVLRKKTEDLRESATSIKKSYNTSLSSSQLQEQSIVSIYSETKSHLAEVAKQYEKQNETLIDQDTQIAALTEELRILKFRQRSNESKFFDV